MDSRGCSPRRPEGSNSAKSPFGRRPGNQDLVPANPVASAAGEPGCNLECGWHYGAFDVRTGEPTASPCEVALRAYPVVIDAGKVCIRRG